MPREKQTYRSERKESGTHYDDRAALVEKTADKMIVLLEKLTINECLNVMSASLVAMILESLMTEETRPRVLQEFNRRAEGMLNTFITAQKAREEADGNND